MGKVKGFKEFDRIDEKYLPVRNRLKNYNEFTVKVKKSELESQSARCMDCGVPFCHSGCPLGNLIPDFNDLVYNKKWKDALEVLHSFLLQNFYLFLLKLKHFHLSYIHNHDLQLLQQQHSHLSF